MCVILSSYGRYPLGTKAVWPSFARDTLALAAFLNLWPFHGPCLAICIFCTPDFPLLGRKCDGFVLSGLWMTFLAADRPAILHSSPPESSVYFCLSWFWSPLCNCLSPMLGPLLNLRFKKTKPKPGNKKAESWELGECFSSVVWSRIFTSGGAMPPSAKPKERCLNRTPLRI